IIESFFTMAAYYYLGIFNPESVSLFLWILPGVIIAMPLGSFLLGKLEPTVFRRVCISFDAWLIAFGLFRALSGGSWMPNSVCYSIFALIVVIDGFTLVRFFKKRNFKL